MKITDISTRIENINHEILYIIDLDRASRLKSDSKIDGVELGGPDMIRAFDGMIEFVKNHNNFLLAMYKCDFGKTGFRWLFCLLYEINNNWQRVQIEYTICENCGWKGKIANPTIPSLYFTLKNRKEALDFAWNLPRINCPSCGKELNQYSIWIEQM